MKKVIKKVKAVKKAPKLVKVVAPKKVIVEAPVKVVTSKRCTACNGSGLQDANNLCPICNGSGKQQ